MIRGFLRTLLTVIVAVVMMHANLARADEKKGVRINGFEMKYVELGPKGAQSVIFLHGFTDSSHSWSTTAPLLADKFRCFLLDQRGHGDSEKPQGGYTVPQLGEDVIAFMDALEIEKATLVGHSMGSFVAHQVASVNPDRVSRLVLVASAPTCVGNPVLPEIWKTYGAPGFKDPIDPKLIEAWQTGPNPVDPAFFAKVLEESAKPPARVWKACLRGLMTDDHRFFLRDIKAPTLIIWGDKDTFFSKTEQDALAEVIPGTVLIAYPGGGHNVQWETGGPEKVAADIRAFLGTP